MVCAFRRANHGGRQGFTVKKRPPRQFSRSSAGDDSSSRSSSQPPSAAREPAARETAAARVAYVLEDIHLVNWRERMKSGDIARNIARRREDTSLFLAFAPVLLGKQDTRATNTLWVMDVDTFERVELSGPLAPPRSRLCGQSGAAWGERPVAELATADFSRTFVLYEGGIAVEDLRADEEGVANAFLAKKTV